MRIGRKIAVPIIGVALATSGFAFLSSNAFGGAPGAGTGTVAISGYTVTNFHNSSCGSGANPQDICFTNFDLQVANPSAPDAGIAYVKFDNGTGTWYSCNAGGYPSPRVRSFTCDLRSPAPVDPASANHMTVSAMG